MFEREENESLNYIEIMLNYYDFAKVVPGLFLPKVVFEKAIDEFYTQMIESGLSGLPLFMYVNNTYKLLGFAELKDGELWLKTEDQDIIDLFDGVDSYDVKIAASNAEFYYMVTENTDVFSNICIDRIDLIPKINKNDDDNESSDEN